MNVIDRDPSTSVAADIKSLPPQVVEVASDVKNRHSTILGLLNNKKMLSRTWSELVLTDTLTDDEKMALLALRTDIDETLKGSCGMSLKSTEGGPGYKVSGANTSLDRLFIEQRPIRVKEANTSCKSFGKNNLDSDINVSIQGKSVNNALNTLYHIQSVLFQIFKDMYNSDERSVVLPQVFKLLDMNFYLSDFAFGFDGRDELTFPRSDAYAQGVKPLSQYVYAFHELLGAHEFHDFAKYKTVYNGLYEREVVEGYASIAAQIDSLINSKCTTDSCDKDSEIIDKFSKLSTFEDECYHTQGAFVHVVMVNQQGLDITCTPEMLAASMIENLCFAYTHKDIPKKCAKYLSRVLDATRRARSATTEHTTETTKAIISVLDSTDISRVLGMSSMMLGGLKIGGDDTRLRTFIESNISHINSVLLNLLAIVFSPSAAAGGSHKLERLKDNEGRPMQKHVKGRMRNIYVDRQRRQYVRVGGAMVRLTDAKATSKKKIRSNK